MSLVTPYHSNNLYYVNKLNEILWIIPDEEMCTNIHWYPRAKLCPTKHKGHTRRQRRSRCPSIHSPWILQGWKGGPSFSSFLSISPPAFLTSPAAWPVPESVCSWSSPYESQGRPSQGLGYLELGPSRAWQVSIRFEFQEGRKYIWKVENNYTSVEKHLYKNIEYHLSNSSLMNVSPNEKRMGYQISL